jgi:hypothetical protein
MELYYALNGNQQGPASEETIKGLLASGALSSDALGWHAGVKDWTPLYSLLAMPPPMPKAGAHGRKGKLLVMPLQTPFEDRCVKCNHPANGYRLKRDLSWHHPGLYCLVFSPIIYLIVALCVRKTTQIHIGVCETHLQKRKQAMIGSWICFGASVLFFVLAAKFESLFFIIGGSILLLGAAFWAALKIPLVSANRIDHTTLWLSGVFPEYLENLKIIP